MQYFERSECLVWNVPHIVWCSRMDASDETVTSNYSICSISNDLKYLQACLKPLSHCWTNLNRDRCASIICVSFVLWCYHVCLSVGLLDQSGINRRQFIQNNNYKKAKLTKLSSIHHTYIRSPLPPAPCCSSFCVWPRAAYSTAAAVTGDIH